MLLGTIVWALWESGPDLWVLAPRLGFLLLLGTWMLTPWTWRKLAIGSQVVSLP